MTIKSKVTPIQRGNMNTLRADATKALQDVMAKHGLKVTLGRIVFEPGREFRCKLTVVQPAADIMPGEKPKVGESWKYGRYTFKILTVKPDTVIGSRWSNTRRYGLIERSYRIPMQAITLNGIKV
jgi:hypothetical protein